MPRHHQSHPESVILNQSFCLPGIVRKCESVIIVFVALLALVWLTASSAAAQSGGATVRLDPPNLEVGQGQVETLNIVIDNAQEVYGIDVRAKFDPSVIEVVDADPSKDGVQMIPGDFIKPDFLVRNIADNQKGTLQYVITEVNPTPPANGSGTVVSILVRGKVLGKRTPFTIDFVQIADRHGRKLPVHVQNGTVSVVTPKPPTPTATSPATPTSAVIETPALEPTVTETPVNPAASGASSDNSILDLLLILIAFGGCFGAIALVAFAAFVILRRPKRGATINRTQVPNPRRTNRWS